MTITINPLAVVAAVLAVLLRMPAPAVAHGGGAVLLMALLVALVLRPRTARSRR